VSGARDSGPRYARRIRVDAETEVSDELAFHLEARVREYVAQGMDPVSARAAALERLGDLGRAGGECVALLSAERRRAARRERLLFSWLDLKLGLRLLLRYPGLTVVGGLAMAFAIAVGAGAFEIVRQIVDPRLPLPAGERIVALRNVDTRIQEVSQPSSEDFLFWREELERIEHVGAFRSIQRNLSVGGDSRAALVAEMSASAFRLTRTPPLLGRTLIDADETPGAPSVVVIGHDVWRERLDGDPDVVGRVVRLGGVETTVVGVMPVGFAFPVAHGVWIPLRPSLAEAGGIGGALHVFGRLVDGATRDGAAAELQALGTYVVEPSPEMRGQLRPEIVPFARDVLGLDLPPGFEPLLYAINVFFVMLLVMVCANVALLMFARAASRESEIVVRNALGAGRGRLVGQLFAEALVLGVLSAAIGLWAARVAVAEWLRVMTLEWEGVVPFWFHAGLEPTTVLYAGLLTLLGAGVAGVVPGLRMTGRGVGGQLRQIAAGAGGPRFGRLWTAVIVAQVAITVAFPSAAFFARRHVAGMQSIDPGFPAAEYLSSRLELDPSEQDPAGQRPAARRHALAGELVRRLAAEPGVSGVVLTSRLPGTLHPRGWVEMDAGPTEAPLATRGHPAVIASVDVDYFDVLGAPIFSGRAFQPGDADPGAGPDAPGVVIVNRSFVERVLGGRNAIGRRLRYQGDAPQPWYEIVGVVPDLGTVSDDPQNLSGTYHPLAPASGLLNLAVHAPGGADAFAPRLRALAAGVDPALRLHDVLPLDEVGSTLWLELDFLFKILAGLSAVALLLSLAAIYASTAFAVARRRREIGIRVALGAGGPRVLRAVFARPLAQVGMGVLAGSLLTGALGYKIMQGGLWPAGVAWVGAYAVLMMAVCLLACVVPTRRALAVEPSEALRAEG
jgi:predicted permease